MLIPRNLLQAVGATTTDPSRYALAAVRAVRDEKRITVEATDGTIAVRLSAPVDAGGTVKDYPTASVGDNGTRELLPTAASLVEDTTAEVLIPAEDATALLKACPKKSILPILRSVLVGQADGKGQGFTTDLESETTRVWTIVDAEFPKLDRLYPQDPKHYTASVVLDAQLLRRLLDVLIKADDGGKKGYTPITLRIKRDKDGGCTTAVRIQAERPMDEYQADCLIMPCRV